MSAFESMGKLSRLFRPVVITEKLDGTQAAVVISTRDETQSAKPLVQVGDFCIHAQSRTRLITPENDNFGFAAWVVTNAEQLVGLGVGRHFGEWWGSGIQRGYGLTNGEKRFSLFNVHRWEDVHGTNSLWKTDKVRNLAPECVHVVPMVHELDEMDTDAIRNVVDVLETHGSFAQTGFMNPEGVVVQHTVSRTLFKVSCDPIEDAGGKGHGA